MYETDSTGVFLYDTTFLQPFTSSDYLQFNNDGTCVISNDYYYYANQDGKQIPPQKIPATSALMNYTVIGSKFVLTPHTRVFNPGGFDVRDTVSNSNSNVLLLHSILYSHAPGYRVVSDAYYTKR